MRTVWKYEIKPGEFTLSMPHGAKVLHVDVQHGKPCMWVDVDTTAPDMKRVFYAHGTGHLIADVNARHVGSFLMNEDSLVFHLFERTGSGSCQ